MKSWRATAIFPCLAPSKSWWSQLLGFQTVNADLHPNISGLGQALTPPFPSRNLLWGKNGRLTLKRPVNHGRMTWKRPLNHGQMTWKRPFGRIHPSLQVSSNTKIVTKWLTKNNYFKNSCSKCCKYSECRNCSAKGNMNLDNSVCEDF